MKVLLYVSIVIASCFIQVSAQSKSSAIKLLMNKVQDFEMLNGAILVADSTGVLYKNAFGKANFELSVPNQIDSKFEIASMSKQFTAILVLQLVEEGKITLETKVSDILKNYPKNTGDKITIRHLLNHTSGLIDTWHIKNFDKTFGVTKVSRDELISAFKDRELLFEPGSKWSYSNFRYNLLALILEQVTQQSIHNLLSERIFKPSGMLNSSTLEEKGVISKKVNGYELDYYTLVTPGFYHDASWSIGSGNIVTTVEDYYKYYQNYCNGKLLSKKMMLELTRKETFTDAQSNNQITTQTCFMYDKIKSKNDTVVFPYASGSHYGAHSIAYHFYDNKKLIVLFINLKVQPIKMFEIGDDITKILYGMPFDLPKDSYLRIFSNDLRTRGVDEAIVHYKKLKTEKKEQLTQSPKDFNRFGYYYLNNGNSEIAIKIFKVNSEIYPDNPDLYDSLGEAFIAIGNKPMAIKNLEKSLELDPKNQHAKDLLKTLKAN
ncbi:MAG: serine hydrolase [bacterium]|nr:serine hydrolase [bacterium]